MADELTPMMRQYQRIKTQTPAGTLLFFRVGDFYELFFDDARIAAPILGVTLTARAGAPLCGVPFHALDNYLAKAIRAGKKVAICDQTEDAALAKGIVRREITRIVTPGTITEDTILDAASNNFLAALYLPDKPPYGVALLDISTGAFTAHACATPEALRDLLRQTAPSECLIPQSRAPLPEPFATLMRDVTPAPAVTNVDDWIFNYDAAYLRLTNHYHVHSLEGLGCENKPHFVCPAGALLHYASESLQSDPQHIRMLQIRHPGETLMLDPATCAHLDILPVRGTASASLLGLLDDTRTPMGARLLRQWLLAPLCHTAPLNARLDALEHLTQNRPLLTSLTETLSHIRDLERLITRISANRSNARDLRGLALSLEPLPQLRALLGVAEYPISNTEYPTEKLTGEVTEEINDEVTNAPSSFPPPTSTSSVGHSVLDIGYSKKLPPSPLPPLLTSLSNAITPQPDLTGEILRALVEAPPLTLKDGGLIQPGYSPELDELHAFSTEGHSWIANYQIQQQERTGIKTLKVRHNRIHGFYIEISKGQTNLAPSDYQRRQTLVNAERYTTPELTAYEQKITGALEKANALEYELFSALREKAAAQLAAVQTTAAAVAALDVLSTLARRGLDLHYTRPRLHDGPELLIRNGRHPIIEQLPDAEPFIPNDTRLDNLRHQISLITGPNMAGKSTYIRQVALIAILAHIGSFVPADEAQIPMLDRIFTRVGAGDDLTRGRSTFMVEMQETANILNNATPRSLIVLDEIGRGTSTFDGISIAWSVAEYLHNTPSCKAKTLFATHYHELTDLTLTLAGLRNYTVQIHEQGDAITFLRKVIPGAADKSYGIHVARLAGLPAPVVRRAYEILSNLEEDEIQPGSGLPSLARRNKKTPPPDDQQLSFF